MSVTFRRTGLACPAISSRALLLGISLSALVAGFAITGSEDAARAVRDAGPELARLLQLMAILKLSLVGVALLAIDWRLRQAAGGWLQAAYLASAAAMAAGPGLVWNLSHLVAGAALLHGGLLSVMVLACLDGGMRPRIGHRIRQSPPTGDRSPP